MEGAGKWRRGVHVYLKGCSGDGFDRVSADAPASIVNMSLACACDRQSDTIRPAVQTGRAGAVVVASRELYCRHHCGADFHAALHSTATVQRRTGFHESRTCISIRTL